LVWRPEGKRPFGRPRRRREVDIKADFNKRGLKDVVKTHLAEDTDHWQASVNTVMKGQLQV
jgi:hypothetical protein